MICIWENYAYIYIYIWERRKCEIYIRNSIYLSIYSSQKIHYLSIYLSESDNPLSIYLSMCVCVCGKMQDLKTWTSFRNCFIFYVTIVTQTSGFYDPFLYNMCEGGCVRVRECEIHRYNKI